MVWILDMSRVAARDRGRGCHENADVYFYLKERLCIEAE